MVPGFKNIKNEVTSHVCYNSLFFILFIRDSQIDSTSTNSKLASCTADCLTGINGIRCYSGASSNKIGFYCFIGDLLTTGSGAMPVMCDVDQSCQVLHTIIHLTLIRHLCLKFKKKITNMCCFFPSLKCCSI